jgi:hypothetical protein
MFWVIIIFYFRKKDKFYRREFPKARLLHTLPQARYCYENGCNNDRAIYTDTLRPRGPTALSNCQAAIDSLLYRLDQIVCDSYIQSMPLFDPLQYHLSLGTNLKSDTTPLKKELSNANPIHQRLQRALVTLQERPTATIAFTHSTLS